MSAGYSDHRMKKDMAMTVVDERQKPRFGHNNPLHTQAAYWDGHRSVRLAADDVGLATTTYSYSLGYDELTEAAERIAMLWNLHLGESADDLRRQLEMRDTTR